MADGADTRVNLAALKRVDPYAVEIVETGTQVAIYKFNSQSNEWEKTDVEGTLFLYARSGDPRHGFVVMNRLSTENLVEPITRDLEIQLQAPFLLYKNAKLSITGVWFYEESECTRIAQKLEALVKEETERRRPNLVQEKSNVDIMSLLTKAGQEYEQVVKHFIFMKGKPMSASNSVDVVRPTALRPTSNGGNSQSTPLSVADLKRKGKQKINLNNCTSSQKNTSGTPPRHTGLHFQLPPQGLSERPDSLPWTFRFPFSLLFTFSLFFLLVSFLFLLFTIFLVFVPTLVLAIIFCLLQYRERERLRRRRSRLRDRFFSRLRDLFRRSFDFDRERVRLRERERDLFLRSRDLERERRRREREDDRTSYLLLQQLLYDVTTSSKFVTVSHDYYLRFCMPRVRKIIHMLLRRSKTTALGKRQTNAGKSMEIQHAASGRERLRCCRRENSTSPLTQIISNYFLETSSTLKPSTELFISPVELLDVSNV
uniref:EOG090X07B6 n=1 Tax=Daphnia magna TaxID=35525 RepID=A0A4Y7MIH4_9CRUS|nr:EOG090X07B6 [Daphnia magna]